MTAAENMNLAQLKVHRKSKQCQDATRFHRIFRIMKICHCEYLYSIA